MSETGKEKTKRAMTILYEVHGNLYINLTNQCPCACTFCLRQTRDHMEESGSLWLEHDTSYEELVAEFTKTDMNPYREASSVDSENRRRRLMCCFAEQLISRNITVCQRESIQTGLETSSMEKISFRKCTD